MQKYYPSINIIRGIAALLVCIYHFTSFSSGGNNLFPSDGVIQAVGSYGIEGIFMFFVISGFVIPLSLIRYDYKIKNIFKFLAKRWIRIEIPYIASMLLIIGLQFFFSVKNEIPFTINFEQVFYHIIYVIPFTEYDWLNVIFWTLAIEFQFYILFAVFFQLINHNKKLLSFATLIIFSWLGYFINDLRLIFTYMPIFTIGIGLLFHYRKKYTLAETLLLYSSVAPVIYLNQGLIVLIFSLLTVVLISILNSKNSIAHLLGNISYSLYLTHGFIGGNLLFFTGVSGNIWGSTVLFFFAMGTSLVFAYVFWYFIEKPSQNLSRRIKL